MEILAIVLSGLFSVLTGGGVILDSLIDKNIRESVVRVEQQAIRVDNAPSYQIIQGKLQKVRFAAKGVEIQPNLRVAVIQLETDAIDFDRSRLNLDSISGLRQSLEKPLQGALRLVVTEADLNRALQSPEIQVKLQQTLNHLIARQISSANISYELINPRVELQPSNRLGLQFKLSRPRLNSDRQTLPSGNPKSELAIALELKIEVLNGKTIQLTEPQGTVNGRPMSSRLLKGFASGISDRLDLSRLKANGILARLLQLEIDGDKIEVAGFARMETKEEQLSSSKDKSN
jgi:LmeA-like phospholipid-binding